MIEPNTNLKSNSDIVCPQFFNIDDVSFTFSVSEAGRCFALKALERFYGRGKVKINPVVEFRPIESDNNYKKLIHFYERRRLCHLGNGAHAKKQLRFMFCSNPICENGEKIRNPFRVQFNPNRLQRDGLIEMCKILNHIFGPHSHEIIPGSRVTRYDLCVDLNEEFNLNKFFIYIPWFENSSNQYVSSKKLFSGVTIGVNRRLCRMYDKELQRTGISSGTLGNRCWHRLEIQIRNSGCSLASLSADEALRVFDRIEFISQLFLDDPYFSDEFKRVVRREGINSALTKMRASGKKKELVRRRLRLYRVENPFKLEADVNLQVDGLAKFLGSLLL